MGWVTSAALLLCLLAAAAIPATPSLRSRDLVAMCLVFASVVGLSLQVRLSIGFAGLWIGLAAGWLLLRPAGAMLVAGCAGVSAALAAALSAGEGVSLFAAASVALAVPVSAALLARRSAGFVTRNLRDEALLGLAIGALCIAAVPTVNEGWQSALILNRTDEGGAQAAIPSWALAFALLALAGGVMRAMWRRR